MVFPFALISSDQIFNKEVIGKIQLITMQNLKVNIGVLLLSHLILQVAGIYVQIIVI